MNKIDKAAAKILSQEAITALQEVADRHGLKVEARGGKYDPTTGTYSPKITFSLPDAERKEFALYAPMFDMTEDDFGKSFTIRNKTYTICGIAPRSTTYPILAKDASGKVFKVPPTITRTLNAQNAQAVDV
jgi:hypothetical protein